MIITEADWQELEAPQGTRRGRSTRRLYPDSRHDLFMAVSQPERRRMLVICVDASAAEGAARALGRLLPTAGLEVGLSMVTRQEYEFRVVLTADDLREVFSPLAADIASVAQEAGTAGEALRVAISRFARWQYLLREVGRDGLGDEARRGLVGELLVLRDFIVPVLPSDVAVEAWTGPTGTSQDFQLGDVAIEAKTNTAKSSSRVEITSERQLDPVGTGQLLLSVVSVDERRGGAGESLNTIVDRTREGLDSAFARARFDDLLVQAGYLRSHRELYKEPRYTLRGVHFWSVRGEFPRIVEGDLRQGVHDCSYHINTSGLDEYLVDQERVASLIGGKHG